MNHARTWLAPLVALLFAGAAAAAPFTPGNVVVYRIGDGVAGLVATGNAVFLDEYTPAGTLVQSIALPSATSGANRSLNASGTATTDGLLTRSANGNCLAVPGYGRDLGTGAGNITTGTGPGASVVPRVVGLVSAIGTVDTTTALGDASLASNVRGAASTDCNQVWISGTQGTAGSGGIRAATRGSTTSNDLSNATFSNTRGVAVFGGQLYASLSVTAIRGVATVGTGTPTSGAQTLTGFTGMTQTNSPATHAFFLADLDGSPGIDTAYLADEAAGVLSKFSLVAGTWTLNGAVGVAADVYRGVTGVVNGSTVTLYATRKANTVGATPGGELVKLTDASGFNGAFAGAPTVIATAAANMVFRGVALAPEVTVTPVSTANGTIAPSTPQVVAGGASVQFTITPDPTYSVVVGGTCGGTLVGNTYTTAAVTVNCTVAPTFTQTPTYIVTPVADPHVAIVPDTPQGVLSGNTIDFTLTPDPGYSVAVGGTCGGTLAGNTFTTNQVFADCTVAPVATLITYTVTPGSDPHGTIAPSTPQVVVSGQATTFTLTPDPGYFSASVGGTCGGALVNNLFTTNAIIADCSVLPNFALLPSYTVTPSAAAHGTISPNTPQSILSGSTAAFAVTADAGYTVVVRGTCGGALVGTTYTTNAITANCTVAATFSRKLVLFLGNSFTFGRVDPVMSYNTANVTDLTYAMWIANPAGSNADEPHPWGGIPGVFKKLTDQAGLDFDVSISARNAASLRGHYLNSNPAGWDLRGNAASQKWDVVVLQDLSDEPMPFGRSANANPPYFDAYADKFETWVHVGAAETYTESQLFGGTTATCTAITHASAGACDTVRTISPANANASAATDVYLYSTWARPDMIGPNGTNPAPGGTYYTAAEGLEAMTLDLHNAYFGRAAANANYKAVNPVGDAFLLAVQQGVAMRDPYAPEAGKINLWHTDFFHPSKYGSYLSALVHFAMITGLDPTTLGMGELAAVDLGISPGDALALQQVAKASVVPKAPAIGTAVAGTSQVTVSFTAPANIGGLAITGYIANCGGHVATGTMSPITVMNVTNGTPVTCTVAATNSVGTGASSAPSNSVTPTPPVVYNVVLEGYQQVAPYVITPATGGGTVSYNPSDHTLTLNIAYSGLAGNETVAHIHGDAARGANAGILINLSASSPKVDVVVLTAEQETSLLAGTLYIDVHTTAHADGEIRGQIDNLGATLLRTLTVSTAGAAQGGLVGGSTEAGTIITCGVSVDCTESIPNGKVATLTAAPQAGNTFDGWSGDCTGTAPCMVTMSADRNVVATFTAIPPDTNPDPFTFTDQADVTPGAAITSNAITVTGIDSSAPITVSGGAYSIGCAVANFVTTAGIVSNGQAVCVRHTAPAALGATTNTVLTIGAVSDTFSSTTIASLPPDGDQDGDGIPNRIEPNEGRNPLVKDNDIFANNRLFAMQQYRDFLGREGDAAGIQFYVDALDSGPMVRANVIENFFNSPEFQGVGSPIARLYFAAFLRTPDYPGLTFQMEAARSGTPLAVIANNFTQSPEFTNTYGSLDNAQFVSLMYTNILDRTASQGEIDFHVARLTGGASRGDVLLGFSESPEYQAAIDSEVFVTMMYAGMLRRAPEPAGLTYWVNYLDAGNPGLALILGFLNAPEYHNRFLP